MLDLSNNMIDTIPNTISELANLSVMNFSGNIKISDLPAQMGLLTKLWNLNTRGNVTRLSTIVEILKILIQNFY